MMVAMKHDVEDAFLHSDLEDKSYMDQPHGFVAQGAQSDMQIAQVFMV